MTLTRQDYEDAAKILGCEPEAIQAVSQVESNGDGFDNQGRPKILFERHIFHRRTKGKYSNAHPNISNKSSGGYSSNEYKRLEQAMLLDHDAALESASWGMYQIMGFNHKLCGHESVTEFVTAMKQSHRQQLDAFVQFIINTNLARALRVKDWYSFARGYNGPAFAKNSYHLKMKSAYNAAKAISDRNIVRDVQSMLTDLGFDPGVIDGIYGKNTRRAILAFETARNMNPTGSVQASVVNKLLEETRS